MEHGNDDGHVGYSEMSVRTFPQAELEGSAMSVVTGGGADAVPVKCELVGSCGIVLHHEIAEVMVEGLDAHLSTCRDGIERI